MYQWILDIDLPELWIKLLIKPNKNVDDVLDAINVELINVCWEYLEDKKLWLDKYQLATICAQLVTLAMERCEEPFRVSVKTTKSLVQEYLEKNKSKRETLERIKKENEELDKEIQEKKRERKNARVIEEPIEEEWPTLGVVKEAKVNQPKKQQRRRWTDALAVDNFKLPL